MPIWLVPIVMAISSPCPTSALRLDWVRHVEASACPSGEHVASLVTERLQCSPFGGAPEAWFEVMVRPTEVGWQARVTRFDADSRVVSEKVLRSDDRDCAVLGEAVALTLAFVAEQLPTVAKTTATATTAQSTITSTVSRETRGPRTRVPVFVTTSTRSDLGAEVPPRGAVRVEAVLNIGTLPQPAFGLQLGASWRLGDPFELGIGALVIPPQRIDAFFFGLVAGSIAGCARFEPTARVHVRTCARFLAGTITGFVTPDALPIRPGPRGWAGASLGMSIESRLVGPVLLRLGVEGLVTLVNRVFEAEVEPSNVEVLNEETVALLTSLGVIIRFR